MYLGRGVWRHRNHETPTVLKAAADLLNKELRYERRRLVDLIPRKEEEGKAEQEVSGDVRRA